MRNGLIVFNGRIFFELEKSGAIVKDGSIDKYKQWEHTQGGYCVLLLWLINVIKTVMYKVRFESVSEIKHTNNI